MSEQDNDATWQHGFDPEQIGFDSEQDNYGQEHGESASAVEQQPAAEEIVVPQKTGKAKSPKSSSDKKQTMIIVGVAVVATIGWIGYGMVTEKPANTTGVAPVSTLHPSRVASSHLASTFPRRPPPMASAPMARATPLQNAAPPPAVATPPAADMSIPPMSSGGSLPMSVPAAPTASPANRQDVVTASAASPALATATPAALAALKKQIAQLKSRISQESLQLEAEKTAAPAPAPKVVYRVIYRDVPVARPQPAPSSPHAPALRGIRVIGAAQGTAWLSVQGHREMAQVGDDVPGLGIVQSISDNGVVRGSHGTARP